MNDKQATWWGLLEALSNVYDPFDLGVLFLFQRLCYSKTSKVIQIAIS